MTRFSVIVPIYKVEKHLRECIESVLTQSYENYELILIDDGSPDDCPQICEEYRKKNKNVRVVHQENRGLSNARNVGLQIADGIYIVFLDGDDVLCKDVLSRLDKLVEKNASLDIIIGNIIHWNGDGEKIIIDNIKYMQEQQSRTIFETNELYARDGVQLPWRAYQSVYKKEFLDRYGLRFDENLIGAEDCDFYLKVIEKVDSYILSDISLVKYRFGRDGSIINAPSYSSIIGQLTTFAKAFEKATIFSDCELMRCYFANRYANIIVLVNMLRNKSKREQCYRFIEDHKDILKFTSKNAKYIFVRLMWKILGFSIGSEVLTKINKLRMYMRK